MSISKNEKSHRCYDSILNKASIRKYIPPSPFTVLGWSIRLGFEMFDEPSGIYKIIYCPYCGKELDSDR